MGHSIEQIAIKHGHNITLRISSGNRHEMTPKNLRQSDVAIEFTNPHAAEENVRVCLEAGIPVVCGSTGWDTVTMKELTTKVNGTFLQTSNFSVGVNLFFEINRILAGLMLPHNQYDVTIEETHHIHKKDAPSGTAITLAERVLSNLTRKKRWSLAPSNDLDTIAITAHRIDDVPGTHKIKYSSAIDDIELIHTAHNREGFAYGAVLAAEYIADKKGIFTMQDVLGL